MTARPAAIAELLIVARRGGGAVPLPSGALTPHQAYRVQESVFAAGGDPVAGWKIGLTGAAGQAAMGSDGPAAGRLAAADIVHAPARLTLSATEYYVEAELLFEIGRDLPPGAAPFTTAHVADAVAALHVGIELVSSRFVTTDLTLGLLLADNCMADRLIVGDRLHHGWADRFADTPVELQVAGAPPVQGSTAAVMGDPLRAVTWLANWLAGRGQGLRAGQWVSSGTCTGATPVAPGDSVTARFSEMGSATIKFAAP